MTIRDLADKSEIGIATIDRIENGIANPTIEVICRLAIALDCSPYDLFYMEE
ncbi:MAG: helix-turn-helix transcriptional regulator [Eubacterium sp.]|nr:helix-turn-helix transcriptional regulator [Eubacterium sp.]